MKKIVSMSSTSFLPALIELPLSPLDLPPNKKQFPDKSCIKDVKHRDIRYNLILDCLKYCIHNYEDFKDYGSYSKTLGELYLTIHSYETKYRVNKPSKSVRFSQEVILPDIKNKIINALVGLKSDTK